MYFLQYSVRIKDKMERTVTLWVGTKSLYICDFYIHESDLTSLFNAKSWLIGKDSDAVRDWGQEEKGMTEDEMAGWHHWLDAP